MTEIIFDAGFSDIFVIRTSGNVIEDYKFGKI
jgi:carbonic anhydrase